MLNINENIKDIFVLLLLVLTLSYSRRTILEQVKKEPQSSQIIIPSSYKLERNQFIEIGILCVNMMKHLNETIISRILDVKRLNFSLPTFQFPFPYSLIYAVNGSPLASESRKGLVKPEIPELSGFLILQVSGGV